MRLAGALPRGVARPEFGVSGVPGLGLSRGLAQEVHHATRDSPEATSGHEKAQSEVLGGDGGAAV